ncbi:MAG: protein kinase domain-containing protein [Solirubrobacterales bacterium]
MSDPGAPGVVLGGRYRLDEVIASGGMATVWAAEDTQLERAVAVKVISETLARDAAFMGRFRREARTAAALAHPNVVRVFDFSPEGDQPFLVMQRLRGGTLAERTATGPPVDPDRLTHQLLSALGHIHDAGVVHRDVKPANILFDSHGDALLTDFGIARAEEATRLTQTGSVIGTLAYMAPELQRGEEATPRSALYSLGVVLRESFDELAPALTGLVATLTVADSAPRPSSAEEALAQLEGTTADTAVIGGEPTAVLPAAAATTSRSGRRRALILGLLGAAAAAAVALALATGGDDDEPSAEPPIAVTTTVTEPEPAEPAPAPDSPAEETPPASAGPPSCEQLEAQKDRLEERKKGAEERVKDDKEAKKEVKERFDERKQELDERIKACKEAEKGN